MKLSKFLLLDARAVNGFYNDDEELIDGAFVLSVCDTYEQAVKDATEFGFDCACFEYDENADDYLINQRPAFMYHSGKIYDERRDKNE